MTPKHFYDWQTAGGTDDVMRLVDCLERGDISWCAIGGIAVNHWAKEPMVTQDVDIVIAAESIEGAVQLFEQAGFKTAINLFHRLCFPGPAPGDQIAEPFLPGAEDLNSRFLAAVSHNGIIAEFESGGKRRFGSHFFFSPHLERYMERSKGCLLTLPAFRNILSYGV